MKPQTTIRAIRIRERAQRDSGGARSPLLASGVDARAIELAEVFDHPAIVEILRQAGPGDDVEIPFVVIVTPAEMVN